ncbi:MFS transporter [Streptomyces sp. NPDC058464]|uniref:MFS transporter n=1 Tax=Streptomyces sp. NPDC058464 TaxID=3346511 RepID=UPI0036575A69
MSTVGIFTCTAFGMSGVFAGSFSVFQQPVTQSLGWATAVFGAVFTVVNVVMAIGSPLVGRLVDRIGVRVPVVAGVVLFALGLFGISQIHSAGALYWISAVCLGLGASLAGPVAAMRVVSSWYDGSRALFLGVVIAAAPQLAQAAVAPTARWLIGSVGWRGAYQVLATAVLVFGGVAAVFLVRTRSAPAGPAVQDAGPRSAGAQPLSEPGVPARRAYRSRTFWFITVADCLVTGALIGTQTNMVGWLTSRGTSGGTATLLLSILALSVLAGVVCCGYLADRIQSPRVTAACYVLPVLSLVCLLAAGNSFGLLVLGVVMMGMGLACAAMLLPFLVTRYFGLKSSAEIYGVSTAANVVSSGVGTLAIGAGFDATGSYTLPIGLAATGTAVSLLLMLTLKPYAYGAAKPEPTGVEGIGNTAPTTV